ncbi:MAG: LLM class F420-dependent oxidoreductase [Hadesarchaea archaeon]|nr:LLM class F420-dependent oxidoreductase [Hadesarchaea archaeon]
MSQEIKFGFIVPQGWKLDLPQELSPTEQFELIRKVTRDAETLGYDSIWFFDHFHTVPKIEHRSVFECWTTLSALVTQTEKIKLGQIVTCNSYRNPALLAKMASILDVVSGGRLILGMGAGWYEHEYLGYGFDFPRAAERIAMLDEAVEIIKRMWTEPVVNFEGKYYRLRGAINYPKPVQKPRPPILIGGGGEKLTLKVVAKHADIYNLWGGTLEDFRRKLEVLKRHCEKIGRNYEEIEKSYSTDVVICESEGEVQDLITELKKEGWEELEEIPEEKIIGTPESCIEQIEKFVELGATYFILYFHRAIQTRSFELFAKKVIPAFKKS